MIQLKRAYEPPSARDGKRILVDRLWPRGTRKEELKLAAWARELAPSNALRQWFQHDPAKWPEFQRRYEAELQQNREAWADLLAKAGHGNLTLIYGAKDPDHNNAVVLKNLLERRMRHRPKRSASRLPAARAKSRGGLPSRPAQRKPGSKSKA